MEDCLQTLLKIFPSFTKSLRQVQHKRENNVDTTRPKELIHIQLVITNTLRATTVLVHLLVVSNVITPDSEEPARRPSQLLILLTVSY